MKKVSLNQLNDVFAAIAKDGSLYIPVDTDAGVAKFEKWEDGKELSKALNTGSLRKGLLLPSG